MTVIGVDTHKRSHTFVATDSGGAKLGEITVPATSTGHRDALQWAQSRFGTDLVWGVEDQRTFASLLERELLAANQVVKRVPPHLMARNRGAGRVWGKSDAIDALAVARAMLREPDLPAAVHDELSWELKMLVDRREDLVTQRVATINRLHGHLHLLDPTRQKVGHLERGEQQRELAAYLAHQPGLTAELARQELTDLGYLSTGITTLTGQIVNRIQELGSSLLSLPGCAELTAAKLIAEAANMDRFRHEAAFARYVGIAPIPLSSGRTHGRVRASRGGNRQCNAAIHRIAVVQIRIDGPGRTYFMRRREEGDTPGIAIAALKRRLCRIVYNRLRADYAARPDHQPKPLTAEVLSAPPTWMRLAERSQSSGEDDGHDDDGAP